MTVTHTINSRIFNNSTGEAKQLALEGPVIITNRGKPEFVLLNFDDFQKLSEGKPAKVSDLLAMPEADGYELDFEKIGIAPRALES